MLQTVRMRLREPFLVAHGPEDNAPSRVHPRLGVGIVWGEYMVAVAEIS